MNMAALKWLATIKAPEDLTLSIGIVVHPRIEENTTHEAAGEVPANVPVGVPDGVPDGVPVSTDLGFPTRAVEF